LVVRTAPSRTEEATIGRKVFGRSRRTQIAMATVRVFGRQIPRVRAYLDGGQADAPYGQVQVGSTLVYAYDFVAVRTFVAAWKDAASRPLTCLPKTVLRRFARCRNDAASTGTSTGPVEAARYWSTPDSKIEGNSAVKACLHLKSHPSGTLESKANSSYYRL
jgi:hypothetical protein